MKIKRLAGFGIVILFSLGMINQATSYTSAQVTSQASMRIVSESENALIGIKVDEDNLTKDGDEIFIPFTITNNMNRRIQGIHIIGSDNNSMGIENNQSITPGGSSEGLGFKYTGNNPSYVKIKFTWNGGSAIIKHLFTLNSSQIDELLEKKDGDLGEKLLDTEKSIIKEKIVATIVPMEEDKDEQKSKDKEISEEKEQNDEEEQENEEKQNIDYVEEESSKSMESLTQ